MEKENTICRSGGDSPSLPHTTYLSPTFLCHEDLGSNLLVKWKENDVSSSLGGHHANTKEKQIRGLNSNSSGHGGVC